MRFPNCSFTGSWVRVIFCLLPANLHDVDLVLISGSPHLLAVGTKSVEKVYLVHPNTHNSRLKSPAYRLCILFVFGYAVVIVLMISNRIAFIRDGNQTIPHPADRISHGTDRACVIGLGALAYVFFSTEACLSVLTNRGWNSSLSLLIYDLILNVFFTWQVSSLFSSCGVSALTQYIRIK
jgi:hypothetical protein